MSDDADGCSFVCRACGERHPGPPLAYAAPAPGAYQPVPDRQVKVGTSPFPTIEIKVTRK